MTGTVQSTRAVISAERADGKTIKIWLGPWYPLPGPSDRARGAWGRDYLFRGEVWTKVIDVDRRPLHVVRPLVTLDPGKPRSPR